MVDVLVSDPDGAWVDDLNEFLVEKGYSVDAGINGKEVQLQIYKKKYFAIILDLATTNHSALLVLKYLKVNAPALKIIITVPNRSFLKEVELTERDLVELGASNVFVKPYSLESLFAALDEEVNILVHKKVVVDQQEAREEEETNLSDSMFTRIDINDFLSGNATVFDLFIRIAKNKYVKILHKGDFFDKKRLHHYRDEKKILHLYFKTQDRAFYINYLSKVAEKFMSAQKVPLKKKLNIVKNASEKYVEEIYTKGLKPQIIEQGKKVCDNMYQLVRTDKKIARLIDECEFEHPNQFQHAFLVSLFSSMIIKQFHWQSKSTVQNVALGSILHDIGKFKIPPEFGEMSPRKMKPKNMEIYQTHPELGVELLGESKLINQAVKLIIHQHHEYYDGTGFPQKLSALKIYRLAGIVSISDYFVHIMTDEKVKPVNAMKIFLKEGEILKRYHSENLKALVNIFIEEEMAVA